MSTLGLKTGDIILFQEEPKCGSIFKLLDWAIRCWTHSPYSHAGLVIVNPPRVNVVTGEINVDQHGQHECLEGTYIWDSSKHFQKDPMDGRIKFGIALVPIDMYLHDNMLLHQKLYKRSPKTPETYALFTESKIRQLYMEVYDKPYDTQIKHWLAGMFRIHITRSNNAFFCSAFVSFALTQMGILEKNTDWTILSPADLSSRADNRLRWTAGHEYGPDTEFSEF